MSANKTILLACENFPNIRWFQQFLTHNPVVIEQHEYFERATLRNRFYVAGPNGLVMLSVPLKGGRNQKTSMRELPISYDEKWQAVHWKTIESCYRRSPYFEYYETPIKQLFEQPFETLLEYNVASIKTMLSLLQTHKEFSFSTEFQKEYSEEHFLDCRKMQTVENCFSNEFVTPNYLQVFQDRHGFMSNLSLLDMLFCVGKPLLKML